DTSEEAYKLSPVKSSEHLLFNHFKGFLAPILNSDNSWEIKAITSASYFAHRSIVQLLVNQLWQWFTDLRRTSASRVNPKMLDNVIYVLRCISQSPDFEILIREPSVFPITIVEVISDFLRVVEGLLNDVSFITAGPVFRIKTAVNYCVIVQRMAEGLKSKMVKFGGGVGDEGEGEAKGLDEEDALGGVGGEGSEVADTAATTSAINGALKGRIPTWDSPSRRTVLNHLKEWYGIVQEVANLVPTSANASTTDRHKLSYYRSRLLSKIGHAAEKMFLLDDVFEGAAGVGAAVGVGVPVPSDMLAWMAKMESSGYKVFTPKLLHNYENVLGTVLAHSYSGGKHTQPLVFADSVFDQILPRPRYGPQLFLNGEDTRVTTSEDYIASIHALAPKPSSSASPSNPLGDMLTPEIDQETSNKIRQNLGSLIFFGLFNMMNSNKTTRNRSFLFVKELFHMYNPDPALDVDLFFAKFTGAFYSNVGFNLKGKILSMSRLAADLFPDDAPGFLWEAVRCSRSVQKSEKSLTLTSSQLLILELIVPWCRYVDLSDTKDVVSAEFFRYLMDAAFYKPKHTEQVRMCWAEVAQSPHHGLENTKVLTEVLVQICGKFDKLREQALALVSRLFAIHPPQVAESLAFYLSSNAFPWKTAARSRAASTEPGSRSSPSGKRTPNGLNGTATTTDDGLGYMGIVRDYVQVLYTAVYGNPPENINEYATSCKSAVMLISELLLQNFPPVAPHLPVLLNYVVLHLPANLQENSVSTYLLANMVEGFISMLHATGNMDNSGFVKSRENVRRLLVLLDSTICFVDWAERSVSSDKDRYLRIPIDEFLQLLLGIFDADYPDLRDHFAAETLSWASEGFLGPEHSVRAIDTYSMLIKAEPPILEDNLDALNSRLFDHISVLSALEQEIRNSAAAGNIMASSMQSQTGPVSKLSTSPRVSAKSPTSPGGPLSPPPPVATVTWETLPEQKKTAKANTENVIKSILRLHQVLIGIQAKTDRLLQFPQLFWISACILHLPSEIFPEIYTMSLDNCSLFLTSIQAQSVLQTHGDGSHTSAAMFLEFFDYIKGSFPGLQPLLLQGLFERGPEIQEKSIDLLLQAWCALPDYIVDANPVALLYTILYTLTWLFANLFEEGMTSNGEFITIESVSGQLRDALNAKRPYEFTEIIKCLQFIQDGDLSIPTDELLERCTLNIADIFFPEFVTNVVEFFGFAVRLGPSFGRVVLKMTHILWETRAGVVGPPLPSPPPLPVSMHSSMPPQHQQRSMGPFKQFVRKLPFLVDNTEDVQALLGYVLHEIADQDMLIKEVDLTSQGRVEGFADGSPPTGSVRSVQGCLSDLGVLPTNPSYAK
ncbi:hypothetical protein HK102_004505, partial [Quaeritorhiza haematococci]